MPAVEAEHTVDDQEVATYELAFHVLPTVAEGEVESVYNALKTHITKAGGQLFDEEAPQRFDLAYDIEKYLEGRNRKFSSAYFGWLRFRLDPQSLATVTESVEATKELLRFLIVRLTKTEEALPFRFHEALADKRVKIIIDEDVVEPDAVVEPVVEAEKAADGEEVKE